MAQPAPSPADLTALKARILDWGREFGFQKIGVAGIELAEDERRLLDWLGRGRHGEMNYMSRHGTRRSRPAELVPGTLRVISARMDYFPEGGPEPFAVLADRRSGYVSRYALGRDYHKLLRTRLRALAARIEAAVVPHGWRVFVDSAPVLEKALAREAGLGWIGKHTNLLDREAGSYFFLGEIYTDLALPPDAPASAHCGRCRACIEACPTGAIVAPYELDARLCISYLTIELAGPIPEPLRPLIGNRIFGCDDCQLVCPWNRFARPSTEADLQPRDGLAAPGLAELMAWEEAEFLRRTEGSALRRLGHLRWLRNLAVALGNGPDEAPARAALVARTEHPSALVREHVAWAQERLDRHRHGAESAGNSPTRSHQQI